MENRSLAALVERLSVEPRVWIRTAATRAEGEWVVNLLEGTIGAAPPGWRRQKWSYPNVLFVATTRPGTTLASWLTEGRMRLRPPMARIDAADWARVERRESAFATVLQALEWPSVVWTLGSATSPPSVHEELVAQRAPAFLSFDQAADAFFALPPRPTRNLSGHEVVIREQDRRGRIDAVLIRPNEVAVRIRGEQLVGARVTLGGARGATTVLERGVREVQLPLGSPLGEGAWVALHRDDELLDRRILDPTWRSRDVETDIDALTRVQVLISRGEGASIEFKRELPESDPRRAMKTAAAFANGGGGTLLFGVDDEGLACGIGPENRRRAADRVASLLSDWVRPRVEFDLERVTLDGADVLVVDVRPGADPPYGVGTTDRHVTYYVRRGANSFPATPDDVRAVVRARAQADASAWPGPAFLRR